MRNFVGQSFMFLKERQNIWQSCMNCLIEVYNQFEEEPDPKAVRDTFYWYASDYCDVFLADRIREQVFAGGVICNRSDHEQ